MTDTPRTDAEAGSYYPELVCTDFTRTLERELRLAEMAAKDNADWFDNLVHDLAAIYGCEKSASAVVRTANEHEAGAAALREALDYVRPYCKAKYGMPDDIEQRLDAALATGAGRELLSELNELREYKAITKS